VVLEAEVIITVVETAVVMVEATAAEPSPLIKRQT